mmetsp:Transcript_126593/g.300703  ORF Transcript_126593/g.300703 Transcript_126593/m.300703 type:complete len:269 (-) Transcript_126593:68-874(-)|eukprot:CAMPEP_0181460676 /NCGR_PEP_ID=MMETSP1110-20121109/33469_1 /TAXON_ID=174948 /ORGANISM="Symbiodinium sp., Strain CCMP421" /LENGTH=268 /DNA_ID=CAMNT_0023585245 /DNA_START=29 /DNA_END=835 /DNA_ORIENTATION=-
MAPTVYFQGPGEAAGARSDRLASPWRGRDRSASPRPDPVTCVVPAAQSECSPASKRHFPDARAEKHNSVCKQTPPRIRCALAPSVLAPWLLQCTSLPQQQSLKAKELAGSMADLASLSHTEKKEAHRGMEMFNVKSLNTNCRKGLLGMRNSQSLPPEVFKASIRKMVESPTSKEGPELQSSAPFFQRQNKKSMARLTGPALRALADMEAEKPRRKVTFKPPTRSVKQLDAADADTTVGGKLDHSATTISHSQTSASSLEGGVEEQEDL